jgi:hypothetical protein
MMLVIAAAALGCGSPEEDGPGDGDGDGDGGIDDPPVVRFVAMGDTGEADEAQYAVGAAIADKCATDGCDFVILLGDNFYDSGVASVDDPLWQTAFELPYAEVDAPFYAVLGNHDYGGRDPVFNTDQGGLGNEFDKGIVEVQYSDVSDKWIMPATHYTFTFEHVGFIMLDTNSLLWDNVDHGNQREWMPTAMSEIAGAEWIFAVGHHPVRSNGSHGNAGSYESIEILGTDVPIPVPILAGDAVADFFDNTLCGNADVYFAGHDHNRQWLDEPEALCGAELIVSGAGAKIKDLDNTSRNDARFQDDQIEGFMYVVIEGDSFTGEFIDKNGTSNFIHRFSR